MKHERHKLVVIGGGFGGLQVVHGLKGAGLDITLVDQRNHHLFQPFLYQVATSILPTSEIAWPIRHIFARRRDVTTLMGEVTGIDRAARQVGLRDGKRLPYDTLVIATGARHSYFGNDGWEKAAPGLKTLEDATTIRRRMLLAFERAESATSKAEAQAHLTFAIIGAGPTGVELAGIIAELAQTTLRREFRNIDTATAKVLLIEAGPRVLSAFPDSLSEYAATALEKLGVTVLCGTPVTQCTPEAITLGDQVIPCKTAVWAAGVAASPAAGWLGAEADRVGRVKVEADLTLEHAPEIFVVGDTAAVVAEDGTPVPNVAPAAKQMGKFVGKVIRARRKGKPAPRAFKYRHAGNLATIGKRAAVVHMGRLKLKGALAWWFWGLAHIYFLIGTRSRIAVAWSWLWSYMTGHNNARLITQSRPDE